MITFKHRGSFQHTERFFAKASKADVQQLLARYGQAGVEALAAATPIDTGETAKAWRYEIRQNRQGVSIYWSNTHVQDGVHIAILLQYGHGTRNGGYVQGRDYINPAIAPIFEQIAQEAWEEVTNP